MKAQVSLEYLILSVVLLVALTFSLGALLSIKGNAEKSQSLILLKNDANNVYSIAEDVCAMGYGNSRKTTLNQRTMIEGTEQAITFSIAGSNSSISKKLSCETEINDNFDGAITIENE